MPRPSFTHQETVLDGSKKGKEKEKRAGWGARERGLNPWDGGGKGEGRQGGQWPQPLAAGLLSPRSKAEHLAADKSCSRQEKRGTNRASLGFCPGGELPAPHCVPPPGAARWAPSPLPHPHCGAQSRSILWLRQEQLPEGTSTEVTISTKKRGKGRTVPGSRGCLTDRSFRHPH